MNEARVRGEQEIIRDGKALARRHGLKLRLTPERGGYAYEWRHPLYGKAPGCPYGWSHGSRADARDEAHVALGERDTRKPPEAQPHRHRTPEELAQATAAMARKVGR